MLSTINYSIPVSFWRLLFWNELTEASGNADARNALSARNANADEGAEEEISDNNLVNVHVTVKVGWSIQRSQVCIKIKVLKILLGFVEGGPHIKMQWDLW